MTLSRKIPNGRKIWFNLTSSNNWNRPPVGVIRVEQNIFNELTRIYGDDTVIPCVWENNQFVRIKGPVASKDADLEAMVRSLVPSGGNFEMTYNALYRFAELADHKGSVNREKHARLLDNRPSPGRGDILITMGLDWDQAFKERLYDFREKGGLRVVTCCYDLIPALFPQYCVGDVARYFKDYFYNLGWGSDLVLCISQRSRDDFLNLMDQMAIPVPRTEVIELGDNIAEIGEEALSLDSLMVSEDIDTKVKRILSGDYLLFVSTIERRKNHEVLYRAYHLLCAAGHKNLPKLVFVGMQGWGVQDLMSDIQLDPLVKDQIICLNHVSDEELAALYHHALFCVYPSLYEGWGLPVAEALSAGQFILSSDRGSLPEVGGDLVTYVDPWSPKAWAEQILDYASDREKLNAAKARVRANYSPRQWAKTVEPVLSFLESKPKDVTSWSFKPGDQMSSIVGIASRGTLKSDRNPGYLMFGPHISLRPGRYKVFVHATMNGGSAEDIALDICHRSGQTILSKFTFANADTKGPLVAEAVFELEYYVYDLEVRAKITAQIDICIEQVRIEIMA